MPQTCVNRSAVILALFITLCYHGNECFGADNHSGRMNVHRQEHLVLRNRAPRDLLHEIVFAVRQRNSENLEAELLERSSPESPMYQQWMTFEQVGDFTSNPVGAEKIKDWLQQSNATVTWTSLHSDYIKATATVQVWEYLFSTVFHEWEDTGRAQYMKSRRSPAASIDGEVEKPSWLILAKEYTIPMHMREHLETAFNTVQVTLSFTTYHRSTFMTGRG
jgi:Pro-kumamolisin, activation domain